MKPKRLSRRFIYRNPWLSLSVDKVRFPAGRLVDFHVVHFKRESTASVIEDARGRVLLVRSYRYTTDSLEWELPAGAMERGETPLQGARRESLEESGYETRGHRLVYTFHPVNGMSAKVFHVVRCRAGRRTGRPDPNEVQRVRWFTKPELKRMVRANRIRDAFSLVGLLLLFSGLKK